MILSQNPIKHRNLYFDTLKQSNYTILIGDISYTLYRKKYHDKSRADRIWLLGTELSA